MYEFMNNITIVKPKPPILVIETSNLGHLFSFWSPIKTLDFGHFHLDSQAGDSMYRRPMCCAVCSSKILFKKILPDYNFSFHFYSPDSRLISPPKAEATAKKPKADDDDKFSSKF